MRAGRAVLWGVVAGALVMSTAGFGWAIGMRGVERSAPIANGVESTTDVALARVWHAPPPQSDAFFARAWREGAREWAKWQEQAREQEANDARVLGREAHAVPFPLDTVKSIVVPHHLLVAENSAGVLRGVSEEVPRPSHILLLSPNHFHQGVERAAVSERGAWVLPDGKEVFADAHAARTVLENEATILHVSEEAFREEHGITSLLPFIDRAFPGVPLVPIALDASLSQEQAAAIGAELARTFPKALLVASVDFSHYLPRAPQEFHDAVSRACLARNGCVANVEADAPSVLHALWAWNTAQGTERFEERAHTSSMALGAAQQGADNTSHFVGFYTKGEHRKTPMASFLFTGDIMLDRRVRMFMEKEGVEYPWKNLERWFMGTQAVVGNLEGTVNERVSKYTFNPPFEFVFSPQAVAEVAKRFTAVSLANNHARDVGFKGEQESHIWLDGMHLPWFGGWESPSPVLDAMVGDLPVTYIGYHAFRPKEEELLRLITEVDERGRFVIVLPHWGVEYQFKHSGEQERLALAMAKAGADLIVGMHPHVVQDVDVVRGVPVFYSLGNFIFDQEISATWPATGMGVLLDGDELKVYALPLWTRSGQPTPIDGEKAAPVYERLQMPAEPVAAQVAIPNYPKPQWYNSINFIPAF